MKCVYDLTFKLNVSPLIPESYKVNGFVYKLREYINSLLFDPIDLASSSEVRTNLTAYQRSFTFSVSILDDIHFLLPM